MKKILQTITQQPFHTRFQNAYLLWNSRLLMNKGAKMIQIPASLKISIQFLVYAIFVTCILAMFQNIVAPAV